MLMVDVASPIRKEVTKAPIPPMASKAETITDETLIRFTISGCTLENRVTSAETALFIIFKFILLLIRKI